MKDFSEVLRALRQENQLTQKKLGELVGATERSIRYYEANQRRPDLDVLIRMANYFEVSIDYLAGRVDRR